MLSHKVYLGIHLHYLCNNSVRLQPSLTGTPNWLTRLEMIDEILNKPRMRMRQRGLMQSHQPF